MKASKFCLYLSFFAVLLSFAAVFVIGRIDQAGVAVGVAAYFHSASVKAKIEEDKS